MINNIKSKELLNRIKFFRERKGYTQEYLANKLYIKQNTYGRIENGLIKLSLDKLIKIAQILEVNLYLLLTGDLISDSNLYDSKKIIQILQDYEWNNDEKNYLKEFFLKEYREY